MGILSDDQNRTMLDRFVGQKSHPCSKCQSRQFHINKMGGLICSGCNPDPEATMKLTGEQGIWQEADFRLVDPSAVESRGVPGNVGECRIDPPEPNRLVYVSPKLLFFIGSLPACYGRDIEFGNGSDKFADVPSGCYRRLDQQYFGWLVSAVSRLKEPQKSEGTRRLQQIACEAVNVEVFGEWALDPLQWPENPRYEPPRPLGPVWID